MTTDEAAFQAALDRDPSDHTTRLVFADWLDEQGDPRAEGYRLLGAAGTDPHAFAATFPWHGMWATRLVRDSVSEVRSTRREAEDATAIAFAALPAERRAELLAVKEV